MSSSPKALSDRLAAFAGELGLGDRYDLNVVPAGPGVDAFPFHEKGIPAASLSREVLSHSLAMVDQDVFLFKGTVRDNLTLWDDSAPAERLQRACSDALIEGVIDALSDGYSSELLEGAVNLSGGQGAVLVG